MHRLRALQWPGVAEERRVLLRSDWCGFCRKLQLATQADARTYLCSLIKSKRFRRRPDDYLLRPYKCPHGNGWHAGHDYAAQRLLKTAARLQKRRSR